MNWCHDILNQSSPQTKLHLDIHPWEIRKSNEYFLQWILRKNSFTLFFDGTSKGNPGEASAGGIIFDPGGNLVMPYAWGIGHRTNNEAEWLALLLGLDPIRQNNISNLIVFGDSKQVIQKMRTGYNRCAAKFRIIYDRIHHLSTNPHVSFFHILRGNNIEADKLANQGVRNEMVLVTIKGYKKKLQTCPLVS